MPVSVPSALSRHCGVGSQVAQSAGESDSLAAVVGGTQSIRRQIYGGSQSDSEADSAPDLTTASDSDLSEDDLDSILASSDGDSVTVEEVEWAPQVPIAEPTDGTAANSPASQFPAPDPLPQTVITTLPVLTDNSPPPVVVASAGAATAVSPSYEEAAVHPLDDVRARWLTRATEIAMKERPTWAARVAAEVAILALVKTHRRALREAAVTPKIFPLSTVLRQEYVTLPESVRGAGTSDADVSHILSFVLKSPIVVSSTPLPDDISPIEAEASPKDAAIPPQVREEWEFERDRQTSSPFAAGRVSVHRIDWASPPPPRAPLAIWTWGRALDVSSLSAEAKATWAKLLAKELANGSLSVVDPDRVAVLTPVFLVQHPVSLKWRLIHDLRAVNVLMRQMLCEYDKVTDALLTRGSFAMKLDLLAAFRHVAVHEMDRRYMAFAIGGVCFAWNALPFGSAQSPAAFVEALKPIVTNLRRAGVRLVVYVDDLLIIADDVPSLTADMARTLQALRASGWYIALDKVYPYPARVIPFLGMLVDFERRAIRVSVAKSIKVAALASALLRRRTVSYVMLARLGGILAFCGQAVPLCRFARLGINAASAEAARRHAGAVAVRGLLKEDLTFWANHGATLHKWSPKELSAGPILVTDAAGPPSWGWGGLAWRATSPAPDIDEMLGRPRVAWLEAEGLICAAGDLDSKGSSPSSAAWELEALVKFLRRIIAKDASIVRGTRVRWFCDSAAATSIVHSWRTKSIGVLQWLKRLFDLCEAYEFDVYPSWVSRALGWQPVADWLSRLTWRRRQAEYYFSEADRGSIMTSLGAGARDFDAFASPLETRMTKSFATRWPCPGALTDGLSAPWDSKAVWAFPPFQDVSKVWAKVSGMPVADVVVIHPVHTPVPPSLASRVVASFTIPPSRLIRVGGDASRCACPVQLSAVHVR